MQTERSTDRATPPGRLRVVGCGNPYAGDDAAGLEIVRRLRERWEGSCELLDRPQAGLELLDCLQGAEVVLFVDAVSSGAPPGTLHLVPLPSPDLEARGLGALSSHGWGLTEALSLMSALGWQAPHLYLLGIEIATLAPDAPRSAVVEAAIRTVVEGFPRLLALLAAESVAPTRTCPVRIGRSADAEPQPAEEQTDAHLKVGATKISPRRFPPGDKSFPGGL
jgi:hydrogenase maturation protease